MFLLGFQDKKGLFVEHTVGIAILARQHDNNTLFERVVFSPGDGFTASRYLSTVSSYMLTTRIASP